MGGRIGWKKQALGGDGMPATSLSFPIYI